MAYFRAEGRFRRMRMKIQNVWLCFIVSLTFISLSGRPPRAQQNTPAATKPAVRDGSHDWDWDIGTWKTHQKRLLHPLTGSTIWVEYSGTDVVRKIWDGANSGSIEADGPSGHLQIFAVRLYNP